MKMMYHRLYERMQETGVQLVTYSDAEFQFYFLKSNEVAMLNKNKSN